MSTQKLFFSYSRSDSTFALKLAKDLRDLGADIWIDQLDIAAGNHWDAAVESALNTAACVLVILSPSSTASTNVMDEVSFALETGKKVIPVLLDDCLAPFRLRRLQRIDFTTDYDAGFNQLVQALNLTVNNLLKNENPPDEPKHEQTSVPDAAAAKIHKNEQWEINLWEDACRLNTIASYKKYLNESLSGQNKAEARLFIKQLELQQKEDEVEALLWQKAKNENTKNLYRHYLEEYPQGNFETLALAALSDLEKAEKLEQKRIKEQEIQQEKEKALKEKQEKEKALKEKQQEKQQEKEKALREKREKQVPGNNGKKYLLIGAGVLVFCVGIWSAFAVYQQKFPTGKYYSKAKEKSDSLYGVQQGLGDSLKASAQTAADSPLKSSSTLNSDSTKKALAVSKPKSTTVTKPSPKLTLGQSYLGGIIISINAAGDHGLIASVKEEGSLNWETAKKVCAAYKTGAYADWHLPTKDELNKLYLGRKYLSIYIKGIYWSSTEENRNSAWIQNFTNGNQSKGNKQSKIPVRAVQTF